MKAESREDVENVEAWAEVIKDILDLIPNEQRMEVLAFVSKDKEKIEREHEEKIARVDARLDTLGLRFLSQIDGLYWRRVPRLKSLVVQMLVRDIVTHHNPKEAAQILFAPHPYGNGSKRPLQDYLRRLPPPRS
jgi:hypothetical protein